MEASRGLLRAAAAAGRGRRLFATVSIVGAPNAGKSTLFNRLVGRSANIAAFRPKALVSPLAGTTRDRLEVPVDWAGASFRLVDTGGVYGLDEVLQAEHAATDDAQSKASRRKQRAPKGKQRRLQVVEQPPPSQQPADVQEALPMERGVEEKVLGAVRDSDVVLYVVDARLGVSPVDERLAPLMRRLRRKDGRPEVMLVANKLDSGHGGEHAAYLAELYELGLGEPYPISAHHGTGIHALLDDVVDCLPLPEEEEQEEEAAHALEALEEADPVARVVDRVAQIARSEGALVAKAAESIRESALAKRESAEAERAAERAAEDGDEYEERAYDDDEYDTEEEREAAAASAAEDAAVATAAAANELAGDLFVSPHADRGLKLAVVGRPNVGKSSLVNHLLGEERMVVHREAGTTRDAVSAALDWHGHRMLVADTAGIRSPGAGGKDREELDRMAVTRAKQMVMASHAVLLVFDSTEGLVRADMSIAQLVIDHQKSCVLLANKTDLLNPTQRDDVRSVVAQRLPTLWYAPVVCGSAVTGEGIEAAMDLVAEAARWRGMRVSRSRLNELFRRAQVLRPLPMVRALKGPAQAGRLRIKWVVQAQTEAPTFVFHMNRKADMHPSDLLWLENTIRSQWAFTGTPLRIVLQVRDTRRKRREREGTGSRGYEGAASRRLQLPREAPGG